MNLHRNPRLALRNFQRPSVFLFIAGMFLAAAASASAAQEAEKPGPTLETAKLEQIETIVWEAIENKELAGAVVLVGHRGRVVYRRAFGHRVLRPRRLSMTEDTIFDLASLTKVVATTSSVMKLWEEGKLALQDPVEKYFPEFAAEGKKEITVRDLLTHYSGLRPDLDLRTPWKGYGVAVDLIASEKLIAPPRTRFIYSDINFEALGEIVRRVSGKPLDAYAREKIFLPLGMKDTTFRPGPKLRRRAAASERDRRTGRMRWGVVHDPTARRMGGVAGHAGLFSTADDLSIYAQMILKGGTYKNLRMFNPLTVRKMTSPQSPPGKTHRRGLGWDIDSRFSRNRGEMFPLGSFGHTGFTGTSLWIDPGSQTYIIFLSNRLHPDGKGSVTSLRSRVATLVAATLDWAAAMEMGSDEGLSAAPTITSDHERNGPTPRFRTKAVRVQLGLDVLVRRQFAPLAGKRVGLVTNHTGLDSAGRRNIDLFAESPKVTLAAIFSPEHGMEGKVAGGKLVESASADLGSTEIPVHSLYGETRRPTTEMLEGLDALVFDIQDIGARFYTYITTLGYVMEAAAKMKIPVYVLDRPNPLGGILVEGPQLDASQTSFVGYYPLPVRHGMTVGELAQLFNREKKIGCNLKIIPMVGWRRRLWFDQTGVRWVNPSPNIRNLEQATLYPGVALLEGANVSVGRGTDTPFELLGAPWIREVEFAGYLNARQIPGVSFVPVRFTPESDPYQGEECGGVHFVLLDRDELNSPALGIELLAALHKLYPEQFKMDRTLRLVGAEWIIEKIEAGSDPHWVQHEWQAELEEFRKLRDSHLLYR